ncbi:MAG: hypothetical protein WCE75_12890 [Terracidiphilus sp.]
MSLRGRKTVWIGRKALACLALLAAVPACAQYTGQVTKSAKDKPPVLRSIAVLEWTGEFGAPKASRLVPVAVLDGSDLHDGGIYLSRPQPLALAGEVEYELEQNGKIVGLYDIRNSGQEQGAWVGYGAWKPAPAPQPKANELAEMVKIDVNDEDSDKPVLHRKQHPGEAPAGGIGAGTGSPASAPASAPANDPDRPTLHKTASSGSGDSPGTASVPKPVDDDDPDRPTLRRKANTPAADDPERPTVKKGKKKEPEDYGHADALAGVTDPDRPRLKRGRVTGNGLDILPSLMGMPADMQQAVAVSDARNRPEHPWSYTWANPADEGKMKAALEEIARDALGLKPPPPPPAPKKPAARKGAKPAPAPEPPEPPALEDEQFRVFELTYGSGATLVFSARSPGAAGQRKYVTLIAQPDLYGNVLLLLKNVADAAHLDDNPRMRFVDAVDALADNRGELLFELRGATQRQFALYRIVRGRAEQMFAGGGGEFGVEAH